MVVPTTLHLKWFWTEFLHFYSTILVVNIFQSITSKTVMQFSGLYVLFMKTCYKDKVLKKLLNFRENFNKLT